jgi:transcriptional regulator with PAS, ATPase and Fis domain
LDSLRRRRQELEATRATMSVQGLVGCSPAMLNVFRLTLKVAPLSDLPVLVAGETGTGKELLARAIHAFDPKRARGPFVALNCAALTKGLAESELFGHRRGAFTGADRDRKGLIRTAEGGVLFLDEIAELDLELQGKLLRVLQESRVLSVGQDQEVPVSVRVIGATHRDLAERVRIGAFREDLFYRLNVLPIYIPPLRERPEDLPVLVEHFLEKHRPLRPSLRLAPSRDFLEALAGIPLPGNARQLENLVRHALAAKENDLPLELGDLPREVWQQLSAGAPVHATPAPAASAGPPAPADPVTILDSNDWKLARSLEQVERLFLKAALDRARGNQTRTAGLLGITPRSVYSKLRKYQIQP